MLYSCTHMATLGVKGLRTSFQIDTSSVFEGSRAPAFVDRGRAYNEPQAALKHRKRSICPRMGQATRAEKVWRRPLC